MTEEATIRKNQCPSCGAPIVWPEGKPSMPCPYCKAGLERVLPPQDAPPGFGPPAQPQIIIQAGAIPIPPKHAARVAGGAAVAGAGASACSSVMVLLLIFLVVGGIAAAAVLFDPHSPISVNPAPLQVHDPYILVPGVDDGPSDVIAMSYDLAEETYAVGRLSLAEKKFLWRTTPLDSISDVRALAANDTTLFLVEKDDQLKALKLETGASLWEVALADKLSYGDGILAVQGNRVLVLTQDYTLQAFDTATGEEAWQRRLNGYTRAYTLLSHSVAVIDEADDQTSLFFLDLADGSERQRVTPSCEDPGSPGWASGITGSSLFVFAPGSDGTLDTGSVYFLYGSSPSCVERWDVGTGVLAWQSVDEKSYVPSSGDSLVLATPATVYYAYGGQIWAVDQKTAERTSLLDIEDYESLPLTMAGDTLIVRARRTRGSERFALWGVDPATGEQRWVYDLGESQPFQPPDEVSGSLSRGASAWDWRLEGEGLLLFKAGSQPNQFSAERLDTDDGSVTQIFSLPIQTWSEDSYWMDAGIWQGPYYWANLETKVYVLNINTGAFEYSYP
ncbi:MAG: PQQ-binding-like beta-propeller repeat protein [Chloroflexota bacterium]